MSLFFTDQITLHLINSKLRNLAFGAISCCADINYDTLHQAVLAMYRRANGWIFAIGGVLLFCSWLFGGWLWLRSVEIWYTQPSDVNIWNLLTRVFN
jgi:hypothetical protein